jgi:glutamine amidotransferase
MCELMGMSFDRPVDARFSIRAFGCRDEENPDGWGLAWYPDRSLALVKEALTWRSSTYSKFLENYLGLNSPIYIAHVRKKTTGGPATHSDTHPFRREYLGRDVCFAHNGTIGEYASLSIGRFWPVGNTDSERLFCHVLEAMASRGEQLEEPKGWDWLAETFRSINRRGTMNCLMSDGLRLFAYRDLTGWKGLTLRKVRFQPQEPRIFEDEMTGVAVAGDTENRGCVVATRALSTTGWHDIPPGGLVVMHAGRILHTNAPAQMARG